MLMDDYDEESEISDVSIVDNYRLFNTHFNYFVPNFKTEFLLKMKSFAKHHYISMRLFKIKESRTKTRWVHFIDFSENFTFIVQDAIQGYHWKNTQAILQSFLTSVQSNDYLKIISVHIISDCWHMIRWQLLHFKDL